MKVAGWGPLLRLRICAFTAIIVFQADDVVFAKVVSTLNLDDVRGRVERIRDAVDVTDRDVGRLVNAKIEK